MSRVDGRVAALYDIHANLPALRAVLAEVVAAGAELVVIGGDVLPGPLPRESLDALRALPLPVLALRGNGERAVLEVLAGDEPADVPPPYRPALHWTSAQLGPAHCAWIAGWPASLSIEIAGLGEVLFCHATPRSDSELVTRETPAAELAALFEPSGAAVVVCGHTHMQFDRGAGQVRVVNAGSVGMPFGEPGAWWLLLGPAVELRHTPYDLASAADEISASAYPGAEEFARHNVLEPPSAAEMLAAFSRAPSRQATE